MSDEGTSKAMPAYLVEVAYAKGGSGKSNFIVEWFKAGQPKGSDKEDAKRIAYEVVSKLQSEITPPAGQIEFPVPPPEVELLLERSWTLHHDLAHEALRLSHKDWAAVQKSERWLKTVSRHLPVRIANEEAGDLLEQAHALLAQGAPFQGMKLRILWGIVLMHINAWRERWAEWRQSQRG